MKGDRERWWKRITLAGLTYMDLPQYWYLEKCGKIVVSYTIQFLLRWTSCTSDEQCMMGSWKIGHRRTEMRWILKCIHDRLWLSDIFTDYVLTTSINSHLRPPQQQHSAQQHRTFPQTWQPLKSERRQTERWERMTPDGLTYLLRGNYGRLPKMSDSIL